jgi:hypothetical protein
MAVNVRDAHLRGLFAQPKVQLVITTSLTFGCLSQNQTIMLVQGEDRRSCNRRAMMVCAQLSSDNALLPLIPNNNHPRRMNHFQMRPLAPHPSFRHAIPIANGVEWRLDATVWYGWSACAGNMVMQRLVQCTRRRRRIFKRSIMWGLDY